MVVENWIYLDNLRPFLIFLARCVDYDVLPEELTAIGFGVRESDAEAGSWYDYEFANSQSLRFRLAQDPGSTVLHFRVECSPGIGERVKVAATIMAEYRLKGGPG